MIREPQRGGLRRARCAPLPDQHRRGQLSRGPGALCARSGRPRPARKPLPRTLRDAPGPTHGSSRRAPRCLPEGFYCSALVSALSCPVQETLVHMLVQERRSLRPCTSASRRKATIQPISLHAPKDGARDVDLPASRRIPSANCCLNTRTIMDLQISAGEYRCRLLAFISA